MSAQAIDLNFQTDQRVVHAHENYQDENQDAEDDKNSHANYLTERSTRSYASKYTWRGSGCKARPGVVPERRA